MLESVIHITKEPVKFLIIWLHGLGADGYDFLPLAKQIESHLNAPIAFVFPHAPVIPVTINNGMKMRAWYDITDIDFRNEVDSNRITQSTTYLQEIIAAQKSAFDVPDERIILAGFSQGGVIVLNELVQQQHQYAGILALSTYYPYLDQINNMDDHNTPVFIGHGLSDPVVDISLARSVHRQLNQKNPHVSWHEYPMAHQVIPEQINDIVSWINRITDHKKP